MSSIIISTMSIPISAAETTPVARLHSGRVINVDPRLLRPPSMSPKQNSIAEARQRVAKAKLGGEVGVVELCINVEAEWAAEASLMRACGEACMDNLILKTKLDISHEDISHDKLTRLPESFGQLKALQNFDINCNLLSSLPESFGQLMALQQQDISETELTSLPKSFGQLKALQNFDIRCNQLSSLPESFGQLKALQNLNINCNQLSSLPENFCQLTMLQDLEIHCNMLSGLPESFGQL